MYPSELRARQTYADRTTMQRSDSFSPAHLGMPAPLDARGLGLVVAGHAALLTALLVLRPAVERPPPSRPIFAEIVLPDAPAVPEPDAAPTPTVADDEPMPRRPLQPEAEPRPEPLPHVAIAAPSTAPAESAAAIESSAPAESAAPATEDATRIDVPRPAAAQAAPVSDDLRRYVVAVMRQLNRYKTYPRALKKAKVEGTVVLEFTIDADGRLLVSAVQRSSGHADLDRAAMDMLARANPLPAIPDSLGRDELALAIPVEYSLITDR